MKILNLRNFLFRCARIASLGQFLKSYIFDVKQEIEMVYLKWSFCEDVEIDESIAKIVSNECQRSIYRFWVSQGFRKTKQTGKNGKKVVLWVSPMTQSPYTKENEENDYD